MGKVIYATSFIDYLDRLTYELYIYNYFSYIESSFDYTDDIYDFIEKNIFFLKSNLTPKELAVFGKYYISFSPNNRTTWYILFDKTDEDIYVTFIFNNHVKYASYLEL